MTETAVPVRIGIVGTGSISGSLAEAARRSADCEVAAVYSRDEARAAAFAQEYDIPLHFCGWEAFLSSADIDAVYIASPNCMHYPQTMAALESGKHVLCEKPFALCAAQGRAMLDSARNAGLTLLEAIRPIHDPFLRIITDNLPRIGTLRRASFDFCQYSSRYDRFKAGEYVRTFDAALGNAALLDLGVYCLHCCVALFGVPRDIHTRASFLPNGTEAAGTMLLDYGDMQATIAYSKVSQAVVPSFIQGEAGTLTMGTLNQPSFVELCLRGQEPERLPLAPLGPNMNIVYEIETFCRCVRGEATTERWDAQTLAVLSLMDEARAQTGIDFGTSESLTFGWAPGSPK